MKTLGKYSVTRVCSNFIAKSKNQKKKELYIKIIIDDIVAPPPWQPADLDFSKIFNF